jgi:CDP-glycerol glycerophosphotransferase (TagB/SpsB family)
MLGKYDFIAVLHPKLPAEIFDKWRLLNGPHFEFKDTTDLIPLFLQADIMLSDTTSAIQEFMLTTKPIVTYAHKKPNPCVIDVTSPKDLENALDKAISRPEAQLAAIRKEADRNHPYRDGASSGRVIDACIASLHKEKSHLRRKPFNLIRKYKIRKLLHFYTLKSFRRPPVRTKR